MSFWPYILIGVAILIIAVVATAFLVREKDRRKVEYMLDAFEDDELNFRFKENNAFNKTLNRIRWIFERQRQRNEQESWTKLIRVLTHEIMNTVSPIASLSEMLENYAEQPDNEHKIDIKAGLKTISSSSKDLIEFVEKYRQLTGVARPIKKAVLVNELIARVINLTSQECSSSGITCSYSSSNDDILIYADQGLISQIIINLIKNAKEAHATAITITSRLDQDVQTIIEVSNNGEAITTESMEQIFVPFYTTKPKGSGIGLSLSRQIMNQHNGSLDLIESNESNTTFALIFK
ncbi:MAG: sensor histidine kinase [Candidatus Limimorpha sp.]|nr:HAMP domain-containing histidine kinase [Bacteroidales bacterium]MCI7376853.1 HAMP domain-containing histidine kinase [Bacteroidales bacterium]MDD7277537.1 HAMP domain-containing sensor histidine kinase [Bacteroidales bacterium]MDY6074755.1 HAMP domain-containing sensor histidine kinase [Bacteroidales bacterium]